MADNPIPITTVKARGGVTLHVVRYILAVSLALAVAAMIFVYVQAPKPAPVVGAVAPGAG